MMKTGDALPADVKLMEMGDAGPKQVTLGELTKGKTRRAVRGARARSRRPAR